MAITLDGTNGLSFPDNTIQATKGVPATGGSMTGPLTMGGLLDLGSTGQIKFPNAQNASSDVNTLDDYEEGTWTPTYITSGTQPSIASYSNQVGRYVKIGKKVTLQAYISVGSMSSAGTGNISISGIPFVPEGAVGGSAAIGFTAYWTTTPTSAYLPAGGTSIGLYQSINNVLLPASAFNVSSGANYITFTLTYSV